MTDDTICLRSFKPYTIRCRRLDITHVRLVQSHRRPAQARGCREVILWTLKKNSEKQDDKRPPNLQGSGTGNPSWRRGFYLVAYIGVCLPYSKSLGLLIVVGCTFNPRISLLYP
jgi:hypothetical protein